MFEQLSSLQATLVSSRAGKIMASRTRFQMKMDAFRIGTTSMSTAIHPKATALVKVKKIVEAVKIGTLVSS